MGYLTTTYAMTRATLCADGRTVLVWFSLPSTIGAGGSNGFAIYEGESLISHITYLDGDTGIVFVFRANTWFAPTATLRLHYIQPGNGVESVSGADLPTSDVGVYEEYVAPTTPALLNAVVDPTGLTLTLVFDRPMTQGTAYLDTDFNIDASVGGDDIGLTYASGDGTTSHIYDIGKAILQGESVNLDYNGRTDGLEDVGGRDLGAISSRTVTNDSEEDYADIILWSGFDGTITDTTYEALNTDYPTFHEATVGANVGLSTNVKVVGSKSLWFNATLNNCLFSGLSVSPNAGRIGVHARISVNGGSFLTLGGPTMATDYLHLYRAASDRLGVALRAANSPILSFNFVMLLNTWFFLEMAWDLSGPGVTVWVDGVEVGNAAYTGTLAVTYTQLVVGKSSIGSSNAVTGTFDNLMLSSNPDRDLRLISLLEECPRR